MSTLQAFGYATYAHVNIFLNSFKVDQGNLGATKSDKHPYFYNMKLL